MLLEAKEALDKTWQEQFGSAFYRSFHKGDSAVLQQVRIPSGYGEAEFDSVVMVLAKAFVDYIDERNFEEHDEKGSINKLDAFLRSKNLTIDLRLLRDVQSIRSNGTAHGKGANHDKLQNGIVSKDHRADTLDLITNLTNLLNEIIQKLKNCKS